MLETGIRILVIEDDAIFRHQLVCYLEICGARVFEAEDGIEGVAAAALYKPELVLCDLNMPAMDGHEVLACLRVRYPELPIIVISAQSRMDVVARVLRAGARDFLIKPIRDWELVRFSIEQSLNHTPSAMQQLELLEHMDALRRDDRLATRMVRQQLDSTLQEWGPWQVTSEGMGHLFIVESFRVSRSLLILVMELPLLGQDGPFCSALVRMLMNGPYRQYQEGESRLLEQPAKLLSYLNWHLCESGIRQPVSVAALLFSPDDNLLLANAGLASPHWLARCGGMPLGLLRDTDYPLHRRSWHAPFSLQVSNESGAELNLCIQHQQ
ncbi:response regulator [Aeromonas simiae]|uniref:response regulator n=1 Tax=Aeromonas simiae TaxID=218936 RepID=UPI0005AA2A7E|nr:response regulator [Aeromonas simiae]MDO2949218.1 response regulator [Aeromonas simiae]MDO2951200.1 response regulator [Aeromonas simiae]MDO2956436.1 response regulator [Aeromonas simiae]